MKNNIDRLNDLYFIFASVSFNHRSIPPTVYFKYKSTHMWNKIGHFKNDLYQIKKSHGRTKVKYEKKTIALFLPNSWLSIAGMDFTWHYIYSETKLK